MSRTSGRERAYEHLRQLLLTDPSTVGEFINESDVAKEIGVSRTPVREALLLLSAEGLVQLVPNRGAFVPPLTPKQVHEILQARTVIESWAAREALRNLNAPLRALEGCLARQRALQPDAPATDFIRADRDFHSALVAAGGNPVMAQLYESLRTRHVVIGVAAVQRYPERRAHVLAEHEAIVEALASGREASVEDAVRSHLQRTVSRLAGG